MKCLECGIKIYAPSSLNVVVCSECEDGMKSYCGNCYSVVDNRVCKLCKFISSPDGFYRRGIELIKYCLWLKRDRYEYGMR